jgi:hypothetical protein
MHNLFQLHNIQKKSINTMYKYLKIMRTNNGRFPVLIVFMVLSTAYLSTTIFSYKQEGYAQKQSQLSSALSDILTIQNTSMSIPAPNAPVNKQSVPHQIVVALPLRGDGKIWSGTVTFTASKPIEVEVEHKYNPKVIPDAVHGTPYNAKWIDNTTRIALSTMTAFSNTPVIVTNTPISTGSLVFVGSALVFHKTDGIPFTVTYSIDAVAKQLTQK